MALRIQAKWEALRPLSSALCLAAHCCPKWDQPSVTHQCSAQMHSVTEISSLATSARQREGVLPKDEREGCKELFHSLPEVLSLNSALPSRKCGPDCSCTQMNGTFLPCKCPARESHHTSLPPSPNRETISAIHPTPNTLFVLLIL